MEKNIPTFFFTDHHLKASDCNAQGELPLQALFQQLIETATGHADAIGIGFQRMSADGSLWVLSRMSVEMTRMPRVLDDYRIETWVEGYNRHFSERNFCFRLSDGNVIGYCRSVWLAINLQTRRPATLADLESLQAVVRTDIDCPIARQGKLRLPVEPTKEMTYTFHTSDIDFNRHVTSARYVALMVDQFSLEEYDRAFPGRFDIAYQHESYCGETATILSAPDADGALVTAINLPDRTACIGRTLMVPRNQQPANQ